MVHSIMLEVQKSRYKSKSSSSFFAGKEPLAKKTTSRLCRLQGGLNEVLGTEFAFQPNTNIISLFHAFKVFVAEWNA